MKKGSKTNMYMNVGEGVHLDIIEIGMKDRVGVIEPDLAFWAVVERKELAKPNTLANLTKQVEKKQKEFQTEMDALRFGLTPSAVYFNPTERCNLNCSYCYLPPKLRKSDTDMPKKKIFQAVEKLKKYYKKHLPKKVRPQLVFHGSEPMLAKEAVFETIDRFNDYFLFGVQTNGTLFEKEDLDFLTSRNVSIGLSLDGHRKEVSDRTRKNWSGGGTFGKVMNAIKYLDGYKNMSVICTVTSENYKDQTKMVDFFHKYNVPVGMLNPARCTRKSVLKYKPDNLDLAKHYVKALDRTFKIYEKTGRKVVLANFANILLAFAAPAARRLMCDIAPCGGGRAFFAVDANGEVFPCSEFIGLHEFKGGNIFTDQIEKIIVQKPFKEVTSRKLENFQPCASCSIRNFCGAPCPAEVHSMNKTLNAKSHYCEYFIEQAKYALRVLANETHEAYLYDNWKDDTVQSCQIQAI